MTSIYVAKAELRSQSTPRGGLYEGPTSTMRSHGTGNMLEAGLWEHLQFIDKVGTIEVQHPADATGQGQTWNTLASEPIRANNIVVTQNVHI